MKNKVFLILVTVLIFSCKENTGTKENNGTKGNNGVNKFDIVGSLEMSSGPHDLAVKDNYLFACINDKIDVIDISDVSKPVKISTFDDLFEGNNFQSLYRQGNVLYAGCTQAAGVYALDISNPKSVEILHKNLNKIDGNKVKAYDLFVDDKFLWVSGNGMIVKYDKNTLQALGHYTLSGSGNTGEGVWANATNVFMSTINGHVYSFDKNNLSKGIIGDFTFTNQPGHKHWGRSVVGKDNLLYWADWGAGFVTLDISNPEKLKPVAIITQSSFKQDFPDAEGTNVYDVLIHNKNGKIYLANGWSGIVEIDPADTGHVTSFKDYKYKQYYCIEQYDKYVILSDIVGGRNNEMKGIDIIKITD